MKTDEAAMAAGGESRAGRNLRRLHGKTCPSSSSRRLAMIAVVASTFAPHASVAPARAANGDLICPAGFQANFSPTLTATNTHALVSVQVLDFNCVSPNGAYSNLRSGIWIATGTVTSNAGPNPCSLLLTSVMTGRITWSPTGQQSVFTFELNLDPTAGDITASITITSGVLAGRTVTGLGPLVPNADCAANGLRSLVSAGADVFA